MPVIYLRRILHSMLLAGVILVWAGLFPPIAASQGSRAFEVQANQAQVEFPERVIFHLDLSVTSPITAIELEYGVEKTACGQTTSRIAPEMVERSSGRQVYADWTWELRRAGSLPSGARIWWRWHITPKSGESFATPREWITFEDDRFDWLTLTEGQIAVHWYAGEQSFGQDMLRFAVETQARLTADLEQPVHLYFYASADELKSALLFPQRWTGGIAFPDFNTVLIATDAEDMASGRRTVAHELMHLVVHQLSFNCWSPLPRWLDEGLASWAEGEPESAEQELLDAAIAGDQLFSLRALGGSFSAHADRAYLSYAQSRAVVAFLIESYGREKILELLAVFRAGATDDGALEQVYGFDVDQLDDLWRASVGAQPRPTAVAPDASSTPMPTLALWSMEPTVQPASPTPPASATPIPTLLPTPTPRHTHTPTPARATGVALASAPATRVSGFVPTPIGGPVSGTAAADWQKYALGGGGVLIGFVILARMLLLLRRR